MRTGMQNTRRVARELALRVLFQVDVGKQPLAEVLEGANDQIRGGVDAPVTQVVSEARSALRGVVDRAYETYGREMSPPAKRQVRQASEALVRELRDLGAAVSAAAGTMVAHPTDAAVADAEAEARAAADQARANVAKFVARPTVYRDEVAELERVALQHVEQALAAFGRHLPAAEATAAFMRRLVVGATERQRDIDARIEALSASWTLERQAAVDRNIMRIAAYEILYMPEVPTGASINEAIELAKKYSTAESGRFVNGVLGALAAQEGAPEQAVPVEPAQAG